MENLEIDEFSLASLKSRAFAYTLDEVLLSFVFMAIFWDSFEQQTSIERVIILVNQMVFYLVLIKIAYHTFFTAYYGATIGKIIAKIKVIQTDDADIPNLLSSFLRAVVRVIGEMLFFLGFLWFFSNKLRQTWHDLAAKTIVVDA